jgi:hypothetical protein
MNMVMATWRNRRLLSNVNIHLQGVNQSLLCKNHLSNRMPTHGSWKESFNSYTGIITGHILVYLYGCSNKATTKKVVQKRPYYHTHFTDHTIIRTLQSPLIPQNSRLPVCDYQLFSLINNLCVMYISRIRKIPNAHSSPSMKSKPRLRSLRERFLMVSSAGLTRCVGAL